MKYRLSSFTSPGAGPAGICKSLTFTACVIWEPVNPLLLIRADVRFSPFRDSCLRLIVLKFACTLRLSCMLVVPRSEFTLPGLQSLIHAANYLKYWLVLHSWAPGPRDPVPCSDWSAVPLLASHWTRCSKSAHSSSGLGCCSVVVPWNCRPRSFSTRWSTPPGSRGEFIEPFTLIWGRSPLSDCLDTCNEGELLG